jgi:chemotaxis protein histidine kinase CheA
MRTVQAATVDRDVLASVFLVDAWDLVAAIEERMAAVEGAVAGDAALARLGGRLGREATDHGLAGVAELADTMVRLVATDGEPASAAPVAVGEVVERLKRALDGLAADPVPPTDAVERCLAEVDRFYAANPDIVTYFGPESAGHVDTATRSLLALDEDRDPAAAIHAAFRAIHTLKGAAYAVGCRAVGDLAHRVEDVLAGVRDGRIARTAAAVDAVLAAIGGLAALLPSASPRSGRAAAVARVVHLLDDPGLVAPGPAGPVPVATAMAEPPPEEPVVAPPRSLRVSGDRLDALETLAGALASTRRRVDGRLQELTRLSERLGLHPDLQDRMADLIRGLGQDVATIDDLGETIGAEIRRARLVPLGPLFARCAREAREVARQAGKPVRVEIGGDTVETDGAVIEQLGDAVLHLIRNAVAHGIERLDERTAAGKPERATIVLDAARRGASIAITVADDGRGIDVDRVKRSAIECGLLARDEAAALDHRQALALVFQPGLSTASAVTGMSGRGVGLDVVRSIAGGLGGHIEVETTPGTGTRFTLELPLAQPRPDACAEEIRGAQPCDASC